MAIVINPNRRLMPVRIQEQKTVEVKDHHGDVVPIRCLLDMGTMSTLILREFVKKGRASGYN